MSTVSYHLQNGTLPDRESLLEKLRGEAMVRLIPVIVMLGLLGLVGFIGNSFVLLYYTRKQKQTAFTTFILTLCIADLAVCCIAVPIEIYVIRFSYIFESDTTCKLMRYVEYASGFLSCLTLACIAIHRYRMVCTPFKVQISLKKARIICAILVCIAVLGTTPVNIIYANVQVNVTNEFYNDLEGRDCEPDLENAFVAYVVVSPFMILFFLAMITILAVTYSRLGCFYYNYRKKNISKGKPPQNVPGVESPAVRGIKDDKSICKDGPDKTAVEEGTSRSASFEVVTHSEGTEFEQEGRQDTLDKETVRLIILMFIVSCVFILSFVPYFSILIWNFVGKPFQDYYTMSNLFGRSWVLNSAVNPLIYGYFLSDFRKFVGKAILACVYK